jgi:hypothetical protein
MQRTAGVAKKVFAAPWVDCRCARSRGHGNGDADPLRLVPSAVAAIAAARISAPLDVEGVALPAALPVLNLDDRRTAAPRFLYERLPSAPINARETEFRGVGRQHLIAYETAPFGPLAFERPQLGPIATDGDFRRAVYNHFDSALAVASAAAYVRAPTLGAIAPLGKYAKTGKQEKRCYASHL